jgi:hypothetical protein
LRPPFKSLGILGMSHFTSLSHNFLIWDIKRILT